MKYKQLILNHNILSYLDNENKGKEVLLFLHGWGCNAKTMQCIYQQFSDQYHVIALDLPGFGRSQISQPLSLKDYCQIIDSLISKVRVNKINFVTHSFGGRIAMLFATMFPDKIKTLVLINSGGIKNNHWKMILIPILAKIGKLLHLHFLKKIFYQLFISEPDAQAVMNNPNLKVTFQNIVNHDLVDNAKKILCPTLLLWGEKDFITPVEHAYVWEKNIKNTVLKIHSGDHYFFLKDCMWVKKKIDDFYLNL